MAIQGSTPYLTGVGAQVANTLRLRVTDLSEERTLHLPDRSVSRRSPFNTGCLPLNYSSNPGVNVSYEGGPAQERMQLLAIAEISEQLGRAQGGESN